MPSPSLVPAKAHARLRVCVPVWVRAREGKKKRWMDVSPRPFAKPPPPQKKKKKKKNPHSAVYGEI